MKVIKPWINTIILIVLVALAVGAASSAYRWFQVDPGGLREGTARIAVALTPEDHTLLDARDSLSKWLLGLSVALLPGLIVKKTKDGDFRYQQSLLPILAGGLLVVSLYGFFLAQHSITYVLTHGPKYLLYSKFSEFPLIVQFWSLLLAVVVLVIHWTVRAATAALIIGAALLGLPTASQAAEGDHDRQESCIRSWGHTRHIELNDTQLRSAATVVAGVRRRAGVQSSTENCDFANTQLDQLRLLAARSADDNSEGFSEVLSSVERDLASHGAGVGEFLSSLLDSADIWRSASGLLSIRGKLSGGRVMLSGSEVGLTDLDVRVRPGMYSVVILRGGNEVFRRDNVEVIDNHASEVLVP